VEWPPRDDPQAGSEKRDDWWSHEQACVSEGTCPHCLGPLAGYRHVFSSPWDAAIEATVRHCAPCDRQWHPADRLYEPVLPRFKWIDIRPGSLNWAPPPGP